MPIKTDEYPGYYEFTGRKRIEPRLCDVTETGAAVIVNSIGSRASFRNPIAQSILDAAGEDIEKEVRRYTLIPSGGIVITHAGRLMKTTCYLFHVVVTSAAAKYRTDPDLIVPVMTRCVRLADLLEQGTIAIPPLGTGMGRGDRVQVLKQMLNAIIDLLPGCKALDKVIFAATKEKTFALFHNLALADIALARREQELKDALRDFPPSLYGLVGNLLERLEKARAAGERPQQLLQEAEGLIKVGKELAAKLPPTSGAVAGTIQMIINTGGSIIRNVTQQV